jgi:DNA processing protein
VRAAGDPDPAATVQASEDTGERVEDALLHALGFDPVSLDALVGRTGESPGNLQARLLELELEGQVARLPGGLFQRIGNA